MDVNDGSSLADLHQLFEKQRLILVAASERKGEIPKDRKTLKQLISEFMVKYLRTNIIYEQQSDRLLIHQSFIAPPYLPVIKPLGQLTKTYIGDLRLETHHRGSYLVLQAATPATMMTAVMVVMKDEKGDGVVVQLYQQKDNEFCKAVDVIEMNAVYIIKEPFFKLMNDGNYGVRLDHINDIVALSSDNERVPVCWQPRGFELKKDPQAWKEEGNKAMRNHQVYQAAIFYTRALACSPSGAARETIKLNRALANIKLQKYDQALADLAAEDGGYLQSEKGLYRAAHALFNLGRLQESYNILASLLQKFSGCDLVKDLVSQTMIRLREQDLGEYDFKAMYEAATVTPPCLQNATYLGPTEIRSSPGRGRGLFVTKAVAAGDLLLCEKAFAYCYSGAGEGKSASQTHLLINTNTERSFLGTQAELITVIVQKLAHNPSLMPKFNALYHGDYEATTCVNVDGQPVIDTFLVDRIMASNCFGSPRTSRDSHLRSLMMLGEDKTYQTTGLFLQASHINHSCCSNVRRSFVGDMQIVRASQDMQAGTEMVFEYIGRDFKDLNAKMQKKLENWGFACTCDICKQEQGLKKNIAKNKKSLLKDLMMVLDPGFQLDLAKAERLLSAIEKTYAAPASSVPRPDLLDAYLSLVRYHAKGNAPKAIEWAWRLLKSQGFVVERNDDSNLTSPFEIKKWGLATDHIVEVWLHLWKVYAQVAPYLCQRAEHFARISYKICVGEDVTFDETYGKVAHGTDFEGANFVESLQSLSL